MMNCKLYNDFVQQIKNKFHGVKIEHHETYASYFIPLTINDEKRVTHGADFYNGLPPTHYHWIHTEIGMTDTAEDRWKNKLQIGDFIYYINDDKIAKGEIVFIYKHQQDIYDGGDDTGLIYDTFAWNVNQLWYALLVVNEHNEIELVHGEFAKV